GASAMRTAFANAYRDRFGSDLGECELLVATLSVAATGVERSFEEPLLPPGKPAWPRGKQMLWVAHEWRDVPVFRREDLPGGTLLPGPSIVAEANGTTVIDEGWRARVNEHGHLVIERMREA